MKDALRSFEEAHPELCALTSSEDQFYGFSKGANRLSRFVQWIYVPAVKDATEEGEEGKNTALGKIVARTVRAKIKFEEDIGKLRDETLKRYRAILAGQQGALKELSDALTKRLVQWAHPDASANLIWSEDPRKVQVEEPVARMLATEGLFQGELARFGHGLQRSYLLAILQELASCDDASAPRLILGCEEPELYQHPPQARHLSRVLHSLSQNNAQVVVTTHSPYFVSGSGFENVRMIRLDPATRCSHTRQATFEEVAGRLSAVTGQKVSPIPAQRADLQQALQPNVNEIFFASKLVLVEGIEDHAYITSWMVLTQRLDEYRRHGCHLVAVNGKSNLIKPVVIAQALNIPTFVVFDADGGVNADGRRKQHEMDNKALLRLLGGDEAQFFPPETVWGEQFVMWPHDIGSTLRSDVGDVVWNKTYAEATKGLGSPDGSYQKNPIHIGDHLELLKMAQVVPRSLERLCDQIVRFAAS